MGPAGQSSSGAVEAVAPRLQGQQQRFLEAVDVLGRQQSRYYRKRGGELISTPRRVWTDPGFAIPAYWLEISYSRSSLKALYLQEPW